MEGVKSAFNGRLVTQYKTPKELEAAQERGLTAAPGAELPGLGLDRLHYNNNSGAQAMNLAFLLGAERIILLGYDMQWTGGKKHFFGGHPDTLDRGSPASFVRHFDQLARDLECQNVEVINCTRETALNQFPKASLSSTLTSCTTPVHTVKAG